MAIIKHYGWWLLGWVCLGIYGSAASVVWAAHSFALWFEPYVERVLDRVREYE